MQVTIAGKSLELQQGDITRQEVDAIVNAANSQLSDGSGVNGAIQRRGGAAILAETRRDYPDGCPTGNAVITTAGKLSARFVIHAVGPVWQGGDFGEADLLSSAYRRSLELAAEHRCQSIALPALSTGVYGYPLDEASRVALVTALAHLETHDLPAVVRFVLFDDVAFEAFALILIELTRDD